MGALALTLGVAGPATSQDGVAVIESTGPLDRIVVGSDLRCAVARDGLESFFASEACGTFVNIAGVLYGPSVPAGPSATAYQQVSQSAVTGTGTVADPLRVETTVATPEGLRLAQVDAYVVGRDVMTTTVRIDNTAAGPIDAVVYRAADCAIGGADVAFGALPGPGAVSCVEPTTDTAGNPVPGSGAVTWRPLTGASSFVEDGYFTVWDLAAQGATFPNTCRCDEFIDHGAGLSWPVSLAAGASMTVAHELVATVVAPEAPDPAQVQVDGDPATTERAGFNDPSVAALSASQARFGDSAFAQAASKADYVVVSRDNEFADSLAGAAMSRRGPLLFTAPNTLELAVSEEIDRVLVPGERVYLLGGVAAISQAVEDELRGKGYEVVRLAGDSRMETAVAVADEVRRLNPAAEDVGIARAFGSVDDLTAAWADSVTGGAWAASQEVPILVTPTEELHPAVAAWIDANVPSRTVILGGEAAVGPGVEAALPGDVLRVAGADRAETAAEIAQQLFGFSPDGEREVLVVNAFRPDGWVFGLGAAGLAAERNAAILVVGSDSVPAATGKAVSSCGAPLVETLMLGSAAVIDEAVTAELDTLDGEACT